MFCLNMKTQYTVYEKDCTLFLFIFLGAQCVETPKISFSNRMELLPIFILT